MRGRGWKEGWKEGGMEGGKESIKSDQQCVTLEYLELVTLGSYPRNTI